MKPKVTLINWTPDPMETVWMLWSASKIDGPVPLSVNEVKKTVPKEELEKLFFDVIRQQIPVGEHINFIFMLEGVSVSLREQMVRHRIGTKVGDRVGIDIIPDAHTSTWWSQCFTGDTKIKLLDGTTPTLQEMADNPQQEWWVYSCNKRNQIVPGRATAARRTNENVELVEVHLDNGAVIRCTPNHPWMMRDGQYVGAANLKVGSSLMPLYTKLDKYGYEMFLEPSINKWLYTHQRVDAELNGSLAKGDVVHHSSFKKQNNDPRWLDRMEKIKHIELHSALIIERMKTDPVAHSIALSAGQKRHWAKMSAAEKDAAQKQLAQARMGIDEEKRNQTARATMEQRWATDEWRGKMATILSSNGRKTKGRKQSMSERRMRSIAGKKRAICCDVMPSFKGRKHSAQTKAKMSQARAGRFNHKVVAVRRLEARADVYDITVDEHHNFALASGVFVHNSMRIQDMGKFADNEMYREPETLRGVMIRANDGKEHTAISLYRNLMKEIQFTYKMLVKAGVPMEDAREVIPLGAQHRISWGLNLQSLLHVLGKRGCWVLQLGIWGPIIQGMVDELVKKVHPMFQRIVSPPCIDASGEFSSCLYRLEMARRMDGSDAHSPCTLYLCRDEEGASHLKGDASPALPTMEQAKQMLISSDNLVPRHREMKQRAKDYQKLWGRDSYTWGEIKP